MNLIKNTLFVSGYWQVNGNQKRNHTTYLNNLSDTLQMIQGGKLVFYTSEHETISLIEELCAKYNISLEVKCSAISNLPAAQHAKQFAQQATKMHINDLCFLTVPSKEKGIAHYKRDLTPDPIVYQQLLTIWLSKIYLVSNHIDKEPYCAWIDAGFSRFKYERTNWNLKKLKIDGGHISYFSSPMNFFGNTLPLNAGFLLADNQHWSKLIQQYEECLELFKEVPYAIDEEVILAEVVTRNPELFRQIGKPYNLDNTFKRQIHWQYVKLMKILGK